MATSGSSLQEFKRELERQRRELDRLKQKFRSGGQKIPRRAALGVLGAAFLPAAFTGQTRADQAGTYGARWIADRDANGHQLDNLEEINFTDGTTLTSGDSGGMNSDGDSSVAETLGIHITPGPSKSVDIGAEINSIHDNDASDGDAIFVPPGTYANQKTTIGLTKDVIVGSLGTFRSPGAIIKKQADIVGLETGNDGTVFSGPSVFGLCFDGGDMEDGSPGVLINGVAEIEVKSENHGSHGVHMRSDNGWANKTEFKYFTRANGGDGVRIENNSGGINMNASKWHVVTYDNDGAGFYSRDAYNNWLWLSTQANNKAFDIGDSNGPWQCWVHAEANTKPGSFTHQNWGTNLEPLTPSTEDLPLPIPKSFQRTFIPGGNRNGWSRVVDDNTVTLINRETINEVNTTPVPITNIARSGYFIVVAGQKSDDNATNFVDGITAIHAGSNTLQFSETRGSPANRDYNVNGTALELSMESDTYYVIAKAVGQGP